MPRRKWLIGLLGCGGLLGLLIVALVVVAIVSGPRSETAQSGGGNDNSEEKKKSSTAKTNPQAMTVGVGETAELRDRRFTVNEVQRNYAPQNRFTRAQPGNEFVRVYLTLENTGDQAISYNPFDFEVQDSNGVQKRYRAMSELPYNLESGDLAPGGTVEGNLVFEVTQDDPGLSLLYETNMFSKETVTVEPL